MINSHSLRLSFEFFPPRTAKSENEFTEMLDHLAPLSPEFVSVTYGAGGSSQNKTSQIIKTIIAKTKLKPAAHITAFGASKTELTHLANNYWRMGVRRLVVIRGDSPTKTAYKPHPDGYHKTSDLVKALRQQHDFTIFVSAYPDCHPESANHDHDIDLLKDKVDAGANAVITQFALITDNYLRLRDRIDKNGLNVKFIAGIMPTTNKTRIMKMIDECGVNTPKNFWRMFDKAQNNKLTAHLLGAMYAQHQINKLAANGINDFHIYTLNKTEPTYSLCQSLTFESLTD